MTWDAMQAALRQSGRSTRMLQDALTKSAEGVTVYVVGYNAQHCNMLNIMCADLAANDRSISFDRWVELSNRIHYLTMLEVSNANSRVRVDWINMTIRMLVEGPNVVLIDHYVIERNYGPILAILHQYD